MVKIVKAIYRRTIIPDNTEPGKVVKTYEAEQFEFEAIANKKEETVSDLIDFCEKEVLHQHKRLIAIREVRNDSGHYQEELDKVNDKLSELDSVPECLYDRNKLIKRRKGIVALLEKAK